MENEKFLAEQIITYIGNKRGLLAEIEEAVLEIKHELRAEKINCLDLFSGSGVVARLLKKHSNTLYANDLETYSKIINECYLTNKEEFDENLYQCLSQYGIPKATA